MKHIIFEASNSNKFTTAILIKNSSFNHKDLQKYYVAPLVTQGIKCVDIIAFNLSYNNLGKAPVAFIKEYLANLLPALDSLGVTALYVADANYFKVLIGKTKADTHLGYVMPCSIKGFTHINVVLGINYQALIYNPEIQSKLHMGLEALANHSNGTYKLLGNDIIHSAYYPKSLQEIADALETLHQYPSLTCDVETFSLRFNEAGIGSISFAWDKHNGLAFLCDYKPRNKPFADLFGKQVNNIAVKTLLLKFFTEYKGELTYHNATFDVKILIYELYMATLSDTHGLLTGLDRLCNRMHDTKIIAYLATNTTAGNVLGLKPLAHEFAGNWAIEDIKDIRKIPADKLLQYNLVDALSTHYVRNKYEPIMEQDNQGDLYRGLMLDSLKLIIQTELTGMPMSRKRIQEVKAELLAIEQTQLNIIHSHPVVLSLNLLLQVSTMNAENAKLKVKQHPLSKYTDLVLNPNSSKQLQRLFYEQMGLPIIDYSDTKQPATGADTIEKLVNHTTDINYKELLEALIAYSKVSKILTTFIPAFEKAISRDNSDIVWLHGSFNLGGTVSGRLSSSDPNLQNLPANSIYGKLVKSCFISPPGKLFCGADFNSLEDYISALTTKDPNKLKVYEEGFDGHSLRAAYYFRDKCPNIDMTDPKSVNTLKDENIFGKLRYESKMPTFALTYQGTWHTLVSNLGFSEEKAKEIEAGYHALYTVSDKYIQDRLQQASIDGYVEVAFGLRVRTPLLGQVIFNGPKLPFAAAAEGRTAGNALGQSYGLLNNRAAVDFMKRVWASEYRYRIHPIALIHDAIYLLIDDDINIVEWVNIELIKSMQWQELPEIQHDVVKLGAALDIFYKGWHQPITLENTTSKLAIKKHCLTEARKYDD